MIVQVKAHGTGKPNDPYRANLPTYTLIDHDTTSGYMLVDVPDDLIPDMVYRYPGMSLAKTKNGNVVVAMPETARKAWLRYLDNHHGKPDGFYDLEFAP